MRLLYYGTTPQRSSKIDISEDQVKVGQIPSQAGRGNTIRCRNWHAGMQINAERCRAVIPLPFSTFSHVRHDRTRAYMRDKAVVAL